MDKDRIDRPATPLERAHDKAKSVTFQAFYTFVYLFGALLVVLLAAALHAWWLVLLNIWLLYRAYVHSKNLRWLLTHRGDGSGDGE